MPIGWKLLLEAWRQLWGNIGDAARISLPPLFLLLGVTVSLSASGLLLDFLEKPINGRKLWVVTAAAWVCWVFVLIWIAVAWHRRLLLGERPTGIFPKLSLERSGSYFLGTFVVGICSIFLSLPLLVFSYVTRAILLQSDSAVIVTLGAIAIVLIGLQVHVIFLRVATVLPGEAIDKGTSFLEGWHRTKENQGELLLLSFGYALILTPVAFGYLEYLALVDRMGLGDLETVPLLMFGSVTFLFYWLFLMFGLSLLTVLYRRYIQDRPLE